jgi:antitoxin component of MazEF toxin-antitoxin module
MSMKLNITQWGNSAALRLPAPLLAQLGVKVGDSFAADVAKDRLTLRVIKDERTIELSVVAGQDASLSLRIKDRALGDAGAHLGSGRLQNNSNAADFYQAVIEAVLEYKTGGATVVYNGTAY